VARCEAQRLFAVHSEEEAAKFSEKLRFSEMHALRNSDTKPAKFMVFLVKEKGAPILVPVTK
jgi:hypothetical protein